MRSALHRVSISWKKPFLLEIHICISVKSTTQDLGPFVPNNEFWRENPKNKDMKIMCEYQRDISEAVRIKVSLSVTLIAGRLMLCVPIKVMGERRLWNLLVWE